MLGGLPLLWVSLPAVGLGSFVMSTDTPLLLFWSAGLYCLSALMKLFIQIIAGWDWPAFVLGWPL